MERGEPNPESQNWTRKAVEVALADGRSIVIDVQSENTAEGAHYTFSYTLLGEDWQREVKDCVGGDFDKRLDNYIRSTFWQAYSIKETITE